MSEEQAFPLGVLGGGASRYNLGLVERALRNRFPVSDAIRELVVSQAVAIIRWAKNPRTQLAAMRVLLAADALNVRREAIAGPEPDPEAMAAVAARWEALKTPEGRKALSAELTQLYGEELFAPRPESRDDANPAAPGSAGAPGAEGAPPRSPEQAPALPGPAPGPVAPEAPPQAPAPAPTLLPELANPFAVHGAPRFVGRTPGWDGGP
jgi:hypothetical protein